MQHVAAAGSLLLVMFAAGVAPLPAQGSVHVSPDTVRIVIPIGRSVQEAWRWGVADTPLGHAEYTWTATLAGDTTYSIGFQLFKFFEGRPGTGTFDELLRAGQANVSVVIGPRAQVIRTARPQLRGVDSLLVVELTDAALIETVFARRPQSAMIRTKSPDAEYRQQRVTVFYVNR